MKKLVYKLLGICLHLFVFSQIQAQTCDPDFTIKTEVTNSTCLSNGEIKVTLSGNTDNLTNIQYGLSSTNGFKINPQGDNILRNIPPGTYQLTVRAFCKTDSNIEVYKDVSNVIVGGDYKIPQVSFNASVSRNSYAGCNTGIIVLNVTDGNGNFTFTITSGPAGFATPAVIVPTKDGDLYTLPGQNYPAGDYTIQVDDGCYTSAIEFTLGTVSGFPRFHYEYTNQHYYNFRPDVDNKLGSCGYIYWINESDDINSNADYQRYCLEGMYEIGAAPAGQMPTHWTTWDYNSTQTLLNISPYNISNFYETESISIYTRVKGCENVYTSLTTKIKEPILRIDMRSNTCDSSTYYVQTSKSYDGMLCYPLNLTIKNRKTGTVVYNKSNWLYEINSYDPINLSYNATYDVFMEDQNGTVISDTIGTYTTQKVQVELYFYYCYGYEVMYGYQNYGKPMHCNTDNPIKVTITDPDGAIIQQTIFDGNENMNAQTSPFLAYDEEYIITVEYSDGTIEKIIQKRESPLAKSFTLSLNKYTVDPCKVNFGNLRIDTKEGYWLKGTVFTITGPEGYISQTYTANSFDHDYIFKKTYLPPGIYTLTIIPSCEDQNTIVATYNHPGVYDYKNLGYDSQMTCSGLKITPKGTMTYKGDSITTYFRLDDGPAGGYDKSVVLSGGSFTLSAPGNYILKILNKNDISACGIGDTTIVYTASPFDFDPYATAAYVCFGETIGNIIIKARNGAPPYTYELWDKTNTVKENIGNITTDGSAHFVYGKSNETYTMRITDQCGNNINQQIKVVDLSEPGLAYTPVNTLCSGDTIQLYSLSLGQTTYSWTGPDNFSSTEQNPKIANTTNLMTGWYKVTVKPEFCDIPAQDSVYIRVYAPLTAGEVISDQSVCVRTITPVLSSQTTGGDGSFTYQWQKSEDGISGWKDIPGATSETYQPPVQLKSGIYYYRKISSNKCGTIYSDPITLTTKSCFIPVNPSLRNMGQK